MHWATGRDGEDVAQVPAGRLVAPAVVLDAPTVRPGQNWLPRGREMRVGDVVLNRGERLHAVRLGLLASVGLTLGLISLAIGNKGGLRGENYALAGTLMCAFNLSVIVGIYFALNFVQWGFAPW